MCYLSQRSGLPFFKGTAFPRRVLSNLCLTLSEARLANKETLTVELKR